VQATELLDLCRRYTTQNDENAGKEAAIYLRTDGLKAPETELSGRQLSLEDFRGRLKGLP
jgi:hypothetical protein